MRWLKRLAVSLLVVVVTGVGAVGLALYASVPTLDGEVALAGLQAPVAMEFDEAGVPTVRAGSRLDLARATGYLHGAERFFQMDLMRRDAAGELSALFGAVAVAHDAERRLHGMRRVAETALAGMPPARRAQLEAYAAGVNAALEARAVRPPEYLLLRQRPRPWTPVDTLLAVHAMWFTLTDEDGVRDLSLTRVHDAYPPAMARFLARPGTFLNAALDGSEPAPPPVPPASEFDLRGRLASREVPAERPWEEPPVLGSNAFAVAAGRTSGGAILANDMHLTLRVPNIWYRARLVVEGPEAVDLVGVTLPGAPAVVVGSNGRVAWGFTNSYVDVTDRVLIEPVAGEPARYHTRDGTKAFEERVEVIEVAGGEPVRRPYRDTVFGPVVAVDGRLHAVRWAAHAPEATNVELMRFERTGDVTAALALVGHVGIPAQNLLLADAGGSIAWTVVGRIPARPAGADHDRLIHWRHASTARRWVDRAAVPVVRDPASGVLWTANARQVGGAGLAVLGAGNYAIGARAVQIRDALLAVARHDEMSLLAIALDDRALYLERWRGLLARTVERTVKRTGANGGTAVARADELAAVLKSWSGRALPEDAAYRWVREFRDTVRERVLTTLAAPLALPADERPFAGIRQVEAVVWDLVDAEPLHLLHPAYPTWQALLEDALTRTITRVTREYPGPLAERTWAERNQRTVAHPLSRAVPALGRFLDMPSRAMPGDAFVPRVLRGSQGASERLVVRPGAERDALFHMPGGQSGHPLSPHYRAGFEAWVTGRPEPLLPGPSRWSTRLVPAPG